MTIELWSILLQAGVIVLLLGFGFWFKQVLGQQLKLKDATIEALQAQIEEHKAEISRLQDQTVPAIAQHYQTLKKYADDAAAERKRLAEELGSVALKLRSAEREAPHWTMLGEANGLLTAAGFATNVLNEFRDFINNNERLPEPLAQRMALVLIGGLMEIRTGIEREIKDRRRRLTGLFPAQTAKVIVN